MSNQVLASLSLFGLIGICTFVWLVLWPAIYPKTPPDERPT